MNDGSKKPVRVRMAPSPTGPLHLGTARTALFNYLFARNQGGVFVLRIEDTDVERSTVEYEKDIIDGLKWLGINWDEGPVTQTNTDYTRTKTDGPHKSVLSPPRSACIGEYGPYNQSERVDIYEKYLQKLINDDKAFYCFCSKEELEADRQAMLSQGIAPKYSGKCRNLPKEKAKERLNNGENSVIRFKMPEIELEFNDLIRGKITVDTGLMGDIVIARNLRSPLFIFAGVVDDFEMKITHVIRGEDHISNTPKQILIQKALEFDEVKYAHLPLILAPDRSKLSKRYIETSLVEYKKLGYLPEALVNFMALLGWHPQDDREILKKDELISEFDIKRVQKAGAVFNIDKLEWLNSQYIKSINSERLSEIILDFIPENWKSKKDLILKILEAEKERLKILSDFKTAADFFFELPDYNKGLLIWKGIEENKIKNNLKLLLEEIKKIPEADFDIRGLERVIMPLTEVWGRGELLWPLRASLSGKAASPGPFEIMEILGKEETLKRLEIAINKISL